MAISQGAAIQKHINSLLLSHYNIAHATLQLECINCDPSLLYCEMPDAGRIDRQVREVKTP